VATGGTIHAEVLAALRTAREEQERAGDSR